MVFAVKVWKNVIFMMLFIRVNHLGS